MLEWSEGSQGFYFETSIMMAGIVAVQNDKAKSECVDRWYFGPESDRQANNNQIIEALGKYPDLHPGTVLMAVIQKHCGSFKFTE